MGDNFAFGGGSSSTNINPVVLLIALIAAAFVLFAPRRYLFFQVLAATLLTPFGQEVYVAGFHFFVIRIILLAACVRLTCVKVFLNTPLFGAGTAGLDKLFSLWVICRGLAVVILYRETGAIVSQAALCFDALGTYFLFRYLLQDQEDIFRAIKSLAIIASILALCMTYEYLTHVNVFTYIGMNPYSWVRDGKVRAQAVFANSITAGSIGATLMPLFFWLWKSGRANLAGVAGFAASTVMVVTSVASTPFSTYLLTGLALCMWPLRRRMRTIRWCIVLGVIVLAMVMKAPIWYLLSKFDFVGGHGWDRAYLLDQFVQHTSAWWLLGTKDTASWGLDTWDQCNQFVAEGVTGGMLALVLFVAILSRGFGMIGRARKQVEGDVRQEWLFWCLGAALFSHVVTFLGIDYFDQTRTWWFAFLAMIPAAVSIIDGLSGDESEGHVEAPLEAPYTTERSFGVPLGS